MIWAYMLKNRIYLMSLTLDDNARLEEHLKVMSTFSLLSPKDMEPRLTELVEELTPECFRLRIMTTAEISSRQSTLDANGNSIEDAYKVLAGTSYEPSYQSFFPGNFIASDRWYQHYRTDKERYEYRFDDRGNWIERKTIAIIKDKPAMPTEVTYRKIVYYE